MRLLWQVKEGLSEQVTFELRPGRGDGASWGKELWEKPSWPDSSAKALRQEHAWGF